jgi:ParB/RepB/Spo0J family partition protein
MTEEPTGKTVIPELARELLYLPFHLVVPSNTNPRLNLEKEPFEELKKSIYANGLLQPIVVRPKGDVYEIIGGHRRFAALKALAEKYPDDKRFTRIAVVVVDVDDSMVPVLQLAENLNRSDLSAIEVAEGVARAVSSGVDGQQLADNLGWSRRHLYRYLALADSPKWLREFAVEVKVTKKKLDAAGAATIDPKTSRAATTTETFQGLPASYLFDLIALYSVLRDADAIQLEELGGDKFRPEAERVTRRLATACAVEGWSAARLKLEVKNAKDPTPRKTRRKDTSLVIVNNGKLVIDLERAEKLAGAERGELAAALTAALTILKFKTIVITA